MLPLNQEEGSPQKYANLRENIVSVMLITKLRD
jgi:hypothetical protein